MSQSTTAQATNEHLHHDDEAAHPSSGIDLIVQVGASLVHSFSEAAVERFR
jgi:hypothetical protein